MHTNKHKQEVQTGTHAKKDLSKAPFLFGKMNYIFTAISLAVITLGFIIMSGKSGDIYDMRRTTVAPIVVILGFCLGFVAIFYREKKQEDNAAE
ncbi:MAG: DUF3098 domain-containing protein [Bacteroidetes bacterium]|nr:DUF3098 domain-containing protein [Bacteroidota bacterium]